MENFANSNNKSRYRYLLTEDGKPGIEDGDTKSTLLPRSKTKQVVEVGKNKVIKVNSQYLTIFLSLGWRVEKYND